MTKIHALLIAAGEGKRMGSPKQLLPWGDKTVIEHQIDSLQQANLNVSVVLGANARLIKETITNLDVQVHFNNHWENGMGSSIACGAKELSSKKVSFDGLLITLVDQPLISSNHYLKMIERFEPGKHQIIVSQTDSGITGPPVLFDIAYLEELKTLQGDEGAKPIIKKHSEQVILIRSEDSLEDMDTPEAYQRMLKLANHQS